MRTFHLRKFYTSRFFRENLGPRSFLFLLYNTASRKYELKKIFFGVSALIGILILRELYCYTSPSAALPRIQKDVQAEMNGFDYRSLYKRTNVTHLSSLTPETRGKPLINVILTTFRSGSTFLGQTLNSFPGGYYHYEPLLHFGPLIRITDESQGFRAVDDLLDMFHCDFSRLDQYLTVTKHQWYPITYNYRVWNRMMCPPRYTLDFLSKACRSFPVQNMKVTRLALKFGKYLLEDDELNLKIIYLVRDPRGVLNSRWALPWGQSETNYYKPAGLCRDMVEDYEAAQELMQKYPTKFKVVRYEDFSLAVFGSTMTIMEFLGLPFRKEVGDYIETHTKEFKTKLFKNPNFLTYRDTNATVFRWTRDLSYDQVEDIQENCHTALRVWGYKEADSEYELKTNFYPIYRLTSDLKVVEQ